MSLTDPTALLWGVLALPIVAFYLMKVRPRVVPLATMQFWDAVFAETRFRTAFRRLRDPFSLLIHLAVLGLLVAALAKPFFGTELQNSRRLIIVIDDSAGMSATDASPTRFGRAKVEVGRVIQQLGGYDDAALVTTAARPRVACGLTNDRRALRQALDAIEPADGPRRLADAVALARRLIGDHLRGRVVVVSDGAGGGLADIPNPDALEVIPVGGRAGNVGITRFEARRSLADPIGFEVLIEIANFTDEPVQFTVDIELNGVSVERFPLELAADADWSNTFAKTSHDGGVLTATIERDDALPTDNRAWAVLAERKPLEVTLAAGGETGQGEQFVERVLEALPQVKQPPTVVARGSTPPPADGIAVYYRHVPPVLPPGMVLVIDPVDACDLWKPGPVADGAVLGTLDKASPLLTNVNLERLSLGRVRTLNFIGSAITPATTDSGAALIAAIDRPAGRVLVLPINLDGSDVPLRPVFPILAGNALQWLTHRGGDLQESVASGAMAAVDLRSGVGYQLHGPDGKSRPLPGVPRTVGPLDRCGVWEVRDETGKPAASLACNLASRRDSDLRPAANFHAQPGPYQEARPMLGIPPWFVLAAAAAGLLALEWCLYQRRWLN